MRSEKQRPDTSNQIPGRFSGFWQLVSGFCGLVLLASCPFAFADEPTFRLSAGVRGNVRESSGPIDSEATARAEAAWQRWDWLHLTPFTELRRNIDGASWSRIELGGEVGFTPFKKWSIPFSWVYLGQGLHQAWLSPGRDHPEWESRVLFDIPIESLTLDSRPVRLYLLNEYTYDLRQGSGIRSEIGGGVRVPLPLWESHFLLGWRHIDPVHFSDMDQVEAALQVEF